MSKSIYVLAGLGLFGCIALGLMMQHLLRVQVDRDQSEIALELEEMCGNQFDGPAIVELLSGASAVTMLVKVRARPGVELEKFARSASSLVWRTAYRHEQVPDHLRFEVRPADGGEKVVVQTSRSDLGRLRRRSSRTSRSASPGGAVPSGGR